MLIIHDWDMHTSAWRIVAPGIRNSWESWEKSDSILSGTPDIGQADSSLVNRLSHAGDDHGKGLRQISIVVDVEASAYWWREQAEYRVGTEHGQAIELEHADVVTNSTSMMHTLGKRPYDEQKLDLSALDADDRQAYLGLANRVRDKWIASGRHKATREWLAMQQITAYGWNYRRCWSGNLQVLRRMYFARRHHKLGEWRGWCAWIEQLPYADLITYEKEK